MTFRYLSGPDLNLVSARIDASGNPIAPVVTCTPAAASSSSVNNVSDGAVASATVFGSNPADCQIDIYMDLSQQLKNGSFTIPALVGWTKILTISSTATGFPFSTPPYAKLEGLGGGYAAIYQDIVVRAGTDRTASFNWEANLNGTVYGIIKNLNTGKCLDVTGAWVADTGVEPPPYWFIDHPGGASSGSASIDYVVESAAVCGTATPTLRWKLWSKPTSGFGSAEFSSCNDGEPPNFASIHGHNLEPGMIDPVLEYSTNGLDAVPTWTSVGAVTLTKPSFYKTFTPVSANWWRWRFVGTNKTAPYIGECVIGRTETLPQGPAWGAETSTSYAGVRSQTMSGASSVYLLGRDRIRILNMDFPNRSDATAAAILDLWDKSKQGFYPVVIVPDDTLPDVIFGRIMDPYKARRMFTNVASTSLVIVEDPFPVIRQ